MSERSEDEFMGDKRSESQPGAAETAGTNPLGALATKGLVPARAPAGVAKTKDPEVVPKATRRVYTAEYKLKILKEAESLKGTGQIGAMLRREGLYDQQLSEWRKQLATSLEPAKRGPKPKPVDPNAAELKALRRENMQLKRQLARSELVIDIQKKVASLLGIQLPKTDQGEDS